MHGLIMFLRRRFRRLHDVFRARHILGLNPYALAISHGVDDVGEAAFEWLVDFLWSAHNLFSQGWSAGPLIWN